MVEVFRQNKINGIELVNLTRDDIKELGVSALSDRKKLLWLIHALESEEEESQEATIATPATNDSFLSNCSTQPLRMSL